MPSEGPPIGRSLARSGEVRVGTPVRDPRRPRVSCPPVERKLAPAWMDYRSRLAALVIATVGLVLWFDGADDVLRGVLGVEWPLHLLAAAWVTGSTGALVWYARFRCPFCGEHFHWDLWVANPIADRCVHCGFEKWRDPHAGRALSRRV